jgi:hypothetical protein
MLVVLGIDASVQGRINLAGGSLLNNPSRIGSRNGRISIALLSLEIYNFLETICNPDRINILGVWDKANLASFIPISVVCRVWPVMVTVVG